MKNMYLKRFMAITMAAAMVTTSVPASVFAEDLAVAEQTVVEAPAEETAVAEEAPVVEEPVVEEAVEEDVSVMEEAPVVEEVPAEEVPAADISDLDEELIIQSDVSEMDAADASYEVAPIMEGEPEAPAKVVNLRIDPQDPDMLKWDADQKADYYEILISDGKYTYREYGSMYNMRCTSNTYDLSDLNNHYMTFEAGTGEGEKWTAAQENGKQITLTRNGAALQISVRAVNESPDYDDDGKKTYGAYSDAYSYTLSAKALEKISDFTIDKDGKLSWTQADDNVFAVVTDQNGKEYCNYTQDPATKTTTLPEYVYAYRNFEDIADHLLAWQPDASGNMVPQSDPATGKTLHPLVLGQTYTVKVCEGYRDDVSGKMQYGPWSEPQTVVYTKKVVEKPEVTGGFDYNKEDKYISWNEVAEVEGYEIEITDQSVPGASAVKAPSYYHFNGKIRLDVESNQVFVKGHTYKVVVRSYVFADDEKETKLYSDPAEYTFTYPDDTVTSLGQVTGLKVTTNGTISWNKVDDAYEYEVSVVDANGRSYYRTIPTVAQPTPYCTVDDTNVYGLSDYIDLYTYIAVDGVYEKVIDINGNELVAFREAGQTYKVMVRAIREGVAPGAWSAEATYTVRAEDTGVNSKPAAVTGVKVVTETSRKDNYYYSNLFGAKLIWDFVEDAKRYEFRVKDAAGNVYAEGYKLKDGVLELEYPSISYPPILNPDVSRFPTYDVASLAGMNAFAKADGSTIATIKDPATGKALESMAPGQTYTIEVRAVNVYRANEYADEVVLEGDWSAPVTYTVSALEAIADLRYEPEASKGKDSYYFSYSAKLGYPKLWYQIATDTAFTTASRITGNGWRDYNVSEDSEDEKLENVELAVKFAINKESFNMKPGTTYYVRVISSVKEPTDEEVAALAPVAVAFTTDAAKTPKNITGLRLYKNNDPTFEFRFDAVLEEGVDSYELQYTDNANATEADWIVVGNTGTLDLSQQKDGTYYVRVKAYVLDEDDEKVYGAASNVVTITKSSVTTAISTLKMAEKTQTGYVFTYTGAPRSNEYVEYWVSESNAFPSDRNLTWVGSSGDEKNSRFTIEFTRLTPGKTYYVRARVINNGANTKNPAETRSAFTNTVTLKAVLPRASVSGTVITSKNITLQMNHTSNDEYLSGYEIQKKEGKKYVTLTKTTNSIYKDTKLAADTTYNYRVRPYYYNPTTKKTTNGSWAYAEVTTWGGALNLQAKAKSAKSVKLTWDKISGAAGYEVYRTVGTSAITEISNGYNDVDYYTKSDSFVKWTLVKTLGKSKKSYTDKKLNKNGDYRYKVRAYKTVGKQKYYIEDDINVDLSFSGQLDLVSIQRKANGQTKVSWQPLYGAKGYLVETYDSVNAKWNVEKKITKKQTSSYTFKAVTKDTDFRIRAYKGSEYSRPIEDTLYPYLAAPTGVKAKANAKDGSITVSWNAVAGADYYKVYRTTSSYTVYDKDTKSYSYMDKGYSLLSVYVADATKVIGYKKLNDDEVTMTSIVDRPITYAANGVTNTIYAGPSAGVKYYYFVQACKLGEKYNYASEEDGTPADSYEYDTDATSGFSKAASAMFTNAKVSKPKKLTVKAAKKKVTVSWKKVKGATGYEVYRSTKKKSGYEKIATISKASTKKYVDKTASAGKTYYYKVRAVVQNEAGIDVFSGYTKPKSVKAK